MQGTLRRCSFFQHPFVHLHFILGFWFCFVSVFSLFGSHVHVMSLE